MSDLISREAVLREFTCLSDDAFVINRKIQEIVKKLSSVEPEKCRDCISRESALEILDDYAEDIESGNWGTAYSKARTSMCNLPPVEPERKTGKWIEKEGYDGDVYYDCSVCGNSWTTIDGTPWDNGMNYCPKCGARMEVQNEIRDRD